MPQWGAYLRADPSGQDQVLLGAVEGSAARVVRVDPRDGSEATELDLADFLGQRWVCEQVT
jgi:hypothetical protein